jgi:hypothetical protein
VLNGQDEADLESIQSVVDELETAWENMDSEDRPIVSPVTKTAVGRVIELLTSRLRSLYRPDLTLGQLYDWREVSLRVALPHLLGSSRQALGDPQPIQRMALFILINERRLLESTKERWTELLEAVS